MPLNLLGIMHIEKTMKWLQIIILLKPNMYIETDGVRRAMDSRFVLLVNPSFLQLQSWAAAHVGVSCTRGIK